MVPTTTTTLAEVDVTDGALVASGMCKSFGGTLALRSVDFDLLPGEIHGLVGQNGSGKSTFVKVLAGVEAPDEGNLAIYGSHVKLPMGPGEARRRGLAFVHQNLGLIGDMTVAENLKLSVIKNISAVRWRVRYEHQQARERFRRFGVHLDPNEVVRKLPMADRAYLAIVRALADLEAETRAVDSHGGILVLDESTVSLPESGKLQLFDVMRRIRSEGGSVIFVSHYLDDVLQVSDRITVFRDGSVVDTCMSDAVDASYLIGLVAGRDFVQSVDPGVEIISKRSSAIDCNGSKKRGLSIRHVAGQGLRSVSVEVARGEILGVTGLMGSGYEVLPGVLFGERRAEGGTIVVSSNEMELSSMTPRRAVAAGIAYVPANRQRDGLILSLEAWENVDLLGLGHYHGGWLISKRKMLADANRLMAQYMVRPCDPRLSTVGLSGGNQQKLLLAKWLSRSPNVLLMAEPTQGVDVGARAYIFALIRSAAAAGLAVVCASGDQAEILDLCDRVLVFGGGEVRADLSTEGLSKDSLVHRCYVASSVVPASPGA